MILVPPFEVEDVARIALVADTLGSIMGPGNPLAHE